MASINRWIISDDTNGVSPVGFVGPADSTTMLRKVADHAGRCAVGGCASNLKLALNPVAAQAKITATGVGANGETLTIGNVVITIVTAGATGNQVNIAASATALGAAIAALVNSSASFTGICTAASVAGVITFTASVPGTLGNAFQISEASASLTLTNIWGAAVAGSEGTAKTFAAGR